MGVFWLVLAVLFLIMEIITVNLVSIWFFAGSLLAAVLAFFSVSLLWQIIVMLLVSGVLLFLFWHLRAKLGITEQKVDSTNADRIINQIGEVRVSIVPIDNTGIIKVLGQDWSAISNNGETIEVGKKVRVIALKGVKAVVEML